MSVHKTTSGYVTRWRDGTRNRQRSFDRRADAQRWDDETRRRRQLGTLHTLNVATTTLNSYVIDTWTPTYAPMLALHTREVYAGVYDRHVAPRLGGHALHALTPPVIAAWQAAELHADTGHATIQKARCMLSAVLRTAVEAGLTPANPVRSVRAPRAPLRAEVRPLAPANIEALRHQLSHRDAVLVSLMAYAGLRPAETCGLPWGAVQDRTLIVNAQKTGKRRTVTLLAPLANDLREWRLASGRPADDAPVIPASDGQPMTPNAFNRWRGRVYGPALKRADLPHARPYDLRHSFASLLLHEGRSVIHVARQLGHGAGLTLSTYGHVIDDLNDQHTTAEDAIKAARTRTTREQCGAVEGA